MEKTSPASSGQKKKAAFNPTKKFDSREHPMLSEDSPLNRQILKATGFPDMRALMTALAHPMTEQDINNVATKCGGHLAHHHRVRHLRKLSLDQHGPIPNWEPAPEEETGMDKSYLWDKLGAMSSGIHKRIPHVSRGNFSTGNPTWDQTVKQKLGAKAIGVGDDFREWGSRGGHWFVNALGNKEYGIAPPPFRAKVLDDKNPMDQHIKSHFQRLGVENDWHGNEITYATAEQIHAHALHIAAEHGHDPKEVEQSLLHKQAEGRRQFQAHPMHSVIGMKTRQTVPLKHEELERRRKAGELDTDQEGPKGSGRTQRQKYYKNRPVTDSKTGEVKTEVSRHQAKDEKGTSRFDDKGEAVMEDDMVPELDPKTGKPRILKTGANKGKPKMVPLRKPMLREQLREEYSVKGGILHKRTATKDKLTGKLTEEETPVTEDQDVPIERKMVKNKATGEMEETWPNRDISPEHVGRVVQAFRNIPAKRRQETAKWYSHMAVDFIKDLADASGHSVIKTAGLITYFNNEFGWESGATGAAQHLLGNSLGVKYANDAKNTLADQAAGKPEYQYRGGDERWVIPMYNRQRKPVNDLLNIGANDSKGVMSVARKTLRSSKLGDFFMDMIGASPKETVTLDRHMIKVLGYFRKSRASKDISPEDMKSREIKNISNPGADSVKVGDLYEEQPEVLSDQEYAYFRRVFISAAHQLGMEPRAMQAALWDDFRAREQRSVQGTDFPYWESVQKQIHAMAEENRAKKKKGIKVTPTTIRNIPLSTMPTKLQLKKDALATEEGQDTEEEEEPMAASFRNYFRENRNGL